MGFQFKYLQQSQEIQRPWSLGHNVINVGGKFLHSHTQITAHVNHSKEC
ncbi:uncharacterized protein G2W53_036753 [Senna tora]|uniref:Uncharacterized protein n=1 Tax=Senna tora TaxID=362788 RepID=A0A834STG0_9FABA|nr:uncharacterized protein G2W53_036753 [Senna tora]